MTFSKTLRRPVIFISIASLWLTVGNAAAEREYKPDMIHRQCVDESQTPQGLDPDLLDQCVARKRNPPKSPSRPAAQIPAPSNTTKSATDNKRIIENFQSKADRDPTLDPWSSKPEKNAAKDNRAPVIRGDCAKFSQAGKGAVDWDYVRIENRCSVPIQVVMCYH